MRTGKPIRNSLIRANATLARQIWGVEIGRRQLAAISQLTRRFGFAVALGEIQLLSGNWYVTHSGLLRIAQRRGCMGINTVLEEKLSNPAGDRWVFKATVYKRSSSRGFVGYGDADPSNTSPLVR